MEEWLRTRLRGDAAVAAIVEQRSDWGMRPQGDPKPGIALHLISDIPARRMSGQPTWHDARVQVDCWGSTPGQAIRLRRAVASLFEGLRDLVDDKKYRTFVIDADGRTEPDAASIAHRAQVDLRVSYQI